MENVEGVPLLQRLRLTRRFLACILKRNTRQRRMPDDLRIAMKALSQAQENVPRRCRGPKTSRYVYGLDPLCRDYVPRYVYAEAETTVVDQCTVPVDSDSKECLDGVYNTVSGTLDSDATPQSARPRTSADGECHLPKRDIEVPPEYVESVKADNDGSIRRMAPIAPGPPPTQRPVAAVWPRDVDRMGSIESRLMHFTHTSMDKVRENPDLAFGHAASSVVGGPRHALDCMADQAESSTHFSIWSSLWSKPNKPATISLRTLNDSTMPGRPGRLPARTRWRHMRMWNMSFAEFKAAAKDEIDRFSAQKREVLSLLNDVQRLGERPRPGGSGGQQMTPTFLQTTIPDDNPYLEKKAPTVVSFFSFPHLCLLPYDSERDRNGHKPAYSHWLQPLLQSHFFTQSRDRELQQAVSTLPRASPDECLHVSDIWFLIVGDSMMLSCSRLSVSELSEGLLDFDMENEEIKRDVEVRSHDGRAWLAPVKPTTSLPSFLSMFSDQITNLGGFEATTQFKHGTQMLSSNIWSRMLGSYDHTERVLHLTALKNGPRVAMEQPLFRHVCQLLQHNDTANRYLMLIFARTDCDSSAPYLRNLADKLHALALSCHKEQHSSVYATQTPGEASHLDKWLDMVRAEHAGALSNVDLLKLSEGQKKHLVIAVMAKFIFSFFWPRDFRHPMTDRFWGALMCFLHRRPVEKSPWTQGSLDDDTSFFLSIYPVALKVDSFSRSALIHDTTTRYPDVFHDAWLHFLMSITLLGQGTPHGACAHLRRSSAALEEGSLKLTAKLRLAPIALQELCPLRGIAALCVDKLMKDLNGRSGGASSIYSQAIQRLEFRLTHKPFSRAYQDSVLAFKLEIDAIKAVRDAQLSIFEKFCDARQSRQDAERADGPIESMLSLLGQNPLEGLLQASRKYLLTDIEHFKILRRQLEELESRHRGILTTNKDRQDAAIMAFTIVTMVFLPLSWVAGVFGMNSSAIRDMTRNQRTYWAIAVPLTVVVVTGTLWWTGLCRLWWRWLQKRWVLQMREVEVSGMAPQHGYLLYGHGLVTNIARALGDTSAGSEAASREPKVGNEAC